MRSLSFLTAIVALWSFGAAPESFAAKDADCDKCHAVLSQKKVVHAPMHDSCALCHPGVTPEVPHKKPAELTVPCVKCHESKSLEGKNTHAPVSAGKCLLCHDPHSSDQAGLLTKEPAALCLDCHAEVTKAPHVVAGFSRSGHPLGADEKSKKAEDPLRPGRKFYCVSCHEPHRSDFPMLSRFPKGVKGSCQACHKI